MPRPAMADIRCSTVEILTSFQVRDVDIVVSPTFSALAFISTTGSRSTLLKIIPVSGAAGKSFIVIGFPLWRPTPNALIGLESVLWTSIVLFYSIWRELILFCLLISNNNIPALTDALRLSILSDICILTS